MRLNILCFVAGAWWLQQQPELPDARWAAVAAVVLLATRLVHPSDGAAALTREAVVKAACLACGFAWAAAYAQHRLMDALPPEWEGRDIEVVGVVASLPHASERNVRFELDVERVLTPRAVVPRRIVLSWWGLPGQEPAAVPLLAPGERWQLTVRLRRPRGSANPHGFDYEAWLLERGIRATGHVRARSAHRRLAQSAHAPGYWIERARSGIRERVRAALPGDPYAGVIAALAIGDQRAIPPEQWQAFTRTGVNHLMSISGLHVTMVSGLAFALVYGFWRRVPVLVLALPAAKAAILGALGAALFYALLAGYAVPAQRTVYMLAVVAAALWLGRAESASMVLAVALLVVVLLDPWAVLAAGFWLSFGAVAVILYVSIGRVGREHWLRSWGRVQLAVTLALVPVLLAVFQQVSLVSPVANAIAIPAVSLVVVPLTLLGVIAPFDLLLHAAHLSMALCMALLEWLAELPSAVWQQHAPPAWAVVVAVAAVALLLAPRGVPGRWLGLVGLLPLFAAAPAPLRPGDVEIVMLDVGQGVSALVRTTHHALLYDTGPPFGPGADSGNRIIVPYLRAAGVPRLDMLIVSHDDDDHWGGAASVMQAVPVERTLTSLPDFDPLVILAGPAGRCEAGQRWEWDGVRFEVLHPTRASYDDRSVKDNDRSCVLKVEAPGGSALLPADIERRSEEELLLRAPGSLRADVLLAPHQGSRTSSTLQFVRAVAPRVVVFPVGYRNRFGHPHREVVRRYTEEGVRVFRTDRDGAVLLSLGAEGSINVTPYRAVYRRYWQAPLEGDPVPAPEVFQVGPITHHPSPNLAIAEAGNQVIVHEARRLHEGVADRRAHEAEAALLEILAHSIGLGRGGGRLPMAAPAVLDGTALHEPPDVAIEAAEFALHGEKRLRIRDRRADLETVAHDAGILHQGGALAGVKARYLPRIEARKRAPVVLAFLQYRVPRQPRLRAFQDQELEEAPVVVDRDAPFPVVITDLEVVALAPGAALHAVRDRVRPFTPGSPS